MGTSAKKRVFSGMRPTGRLHVGNLTGALRNWVAMQDDHLCFYCIVDWHAMTSDYEDPGNLPGNVREMAIDWLSAGLDPEKSVIFLQSGVKEHAELHLLLSMVTPVPWLERVPTYKDQVRELAEMGKEIATYGFLGYPVLQAADILLYKGELVPVGKDQLPHLELCREIARRFNHLYGEVFPEPQGLTGEGEVALLPGVDGRKMSKSYNNYIPMSAPAEEVAARVASMITDPARQRRRDPGHPEVCTAFAYRRVFSPGDLDEIDEACRGAAIGCVECKKRLGDAMIEALAPLRERRPAFERDPAMVGEILRRGCARAREHALVTIEEVRRAMSLRDPWAP